MTQNTKPRHPRIAILFDFDETLATKTDHVLCDYLGIDYPDFKREYVTPLQEQGFEDVLAKAWAYIDYSRRQQKPINRDTFTRLARDYPLFPGVEALFGHLRTVARQIEPDVEVEFHMITAGFAEIPQATRIAGEFTSIRGGHYHYDADGQICFVKSIIGHAEKVRYVQMIAKGLAENGANGPADIHKPIPAAEWHVPLEQIIYVGDGSSDMQTLASCTAIRALRWRSIVRRMPHTGTPGTRCFPVGKWTTCCLPIIPPAVPCTRR
ncbi:MAG: hypothetical protein R3E89_12015 [Thiolinea sp.]